MAMHRLKHLWRVLDRFVKRAQVQVACLSKERRRQLGAKAREAERLDRIRNPAKYLGKP
jgi:hypothetical protein